MRRSQKRPGGSTIMLTVCGGNRTRKGADTQQVLASVVRTARQRKLDLPALFATMLRAPSPSSPTYSAFRRRPRQVQHRNERIDARPTRS